MATLILSDGTRSIDFLSASGFKVPQDGIVLPVVSREDTFAEGSDSEGRSRVRSRATNSTAGQISLYLSGATASALWTTIDNLQELVESAHLNKGSISYLGPGASSTVTYDLESISLTDLPQVGIELTQLRCNATITFESKPYGRLATQRLNVQDSYQAMVTALSPSIFLPLGASSGLTDLSGNARNGTAAGGVTVGGVTGPLTVSDGGATDFDGTDDRITTTYATRRNAAKNPSAEVDVGDWTDAGGSVTTRSTADFWDGTACFDCANPGTGSSGPYTLTGNVLTASAAHVASVYVKAKAAGDVGKSIQLIIRELTSGGATVAQTATVATLTSSWQRVEVTQTFGATGVAARVWLVNSGTPGAYNFLFDGLLIEAGTVAGTYFPTTAQLASGEAGWTGTANASASDIGCFANGTTRTFMGWAYRDTSSGVDTIFSGSGATPPVLAFSSGSQNIVWKPDNSTTTTWASGISNGTWFHWELEFAEPTASNNASLYINGTLISAQTNAGQYSANCGNFQLGALTSTTDPFDGKQAWVSLHQSALTATQIRDAYDTGKAQITLDGPIDSFTVESIPGQVPALPVLTLDDASTQARNIVEVGVQHDVDPDNLEPILLEAVTDLDALGGASSTRSGSHSTNIVRSALAPTPIAVCTAAGQPHKGRWKIRTRVYPSATTVLVRLAWRAGDGPFAKEKWVAVPNSAGWFDLDLGTVNIKELPSGHTCEFRIEGKSTSGSPTVDVDIMECIPADSYTKLRGSSSPEVGSGAIVAMDDFSTQTAGAVTGKTPLLVPSGTYSGAGDTDDFQVDTSTRMIYRSAISDSALNNGRFLRCGSGTLGPTIVSVEYRCALGNSVMYGVFLRYADTSNYLLCTYYTVDGMLTLTKKVAGVETVIASSFMLDPGPLGITASVDSSGNAIAYLQAVGSPAVLGAAIAYADTSLASAGALATGGYGIYDATTFTTASAGVRYYDNFSVSTLATSATIINPAINSGYGLDLKHNTALTDNATGTGQGTTPIREGQYLTLPPSTRNNSVHRIVTRARRNDGELGFADEGLDDTLTASLEVTPRVHLTGT